MAEKPPLENVCLLPALRGIDGPTSFQLKLKEQFNSRGIAVHHNPDNPAVQAILIVSGTRRLGSVLSARRRGVRIVQRLDGINYLHKLRHTGVRHYLRSEYANLLLSTTRKRWADFIVYQSAFTREWWQRAYGNTKAGSTVILNGVDLNIYSPEGEGKPPEELIRVAVVEGHLKDGNELALFYAVDFAAELAKVVSLPVELTVVGDVPPAVHEATRGRARELTISFLGVQPREGIPFLNRSAHLLYSAEFNAPCPNAVIEAMACGLPVVGFQSGALPEIVQGNAGRLVPYGSDPWKTGRPDSVSLAQAAVEILDDLPNFRKAARARAETEFDVVAMADRYLSILPG